VAAHERRTRIDWAEEIKELLEVHYPDALKIRLVMDNLNTHSIASLYETFEPETARRLAKRLEIHHTPKHGSWLNIAEIELSAMTNSAWAEGYQLLWIYVPNCANGNQHAIKRKKVLTDSSQPMMQESD
jgi:hypothetical protein